eukprot:RCo018065
MYVRVRVCVPVFLTGRGTRGAVDARVSQKTSRPRVLSHDLVFARGLVPSLAPYLSLCPGGFATVVIGCPLPATVVSPLVIGSVCAELIPEPLPPPLHHYPPPTAFLVASVNSRGVALRCFSPAPPPSSHSYLSFVDSSSLCPPYTAILRLYYFCGCSPFICTKKALGKFKFVVLTS